MRIPWEDRQRLSGDLFCMRGLGLGLVVLVHVLGVDDRHGVRKLFAPERVEPRLVFEFIHSFNMAVMVMGSGVALAAFGRGERSLAEVLSKKWQALVVPWGLWAPLLLLAQAVVSHVPRDANDWRALVRQVPAAWAPDYTIFWFVHVLFWCSLVGWLFLRFAAPGLGRWRGGVYVAAAIGVHLGVTVWRGHAPPGVGEYVALVSYWNRFFGLGLLVQPALPAACRALSRLSTARHALLCLGVLGLLLGVHAVLSREHYEWTCALNGPLGFGLLLSLAVFLRERVRGSRVCRWLGAAGARSMPFYLFHLFFVSGARLGLERVWPGAPLGPHLVLGCLVGALGPWLLFTCLHTRPLFRWSIGLAPLDSRRDRRQDAPRSEPTAISSV